MSDLAPAKPRKAQIRPKLQAAISQIVDHGLKIPEAAEIAGMSYEGLRLALSKPHVREYVSGVARARLEGETFRSWHVVSELRDKGQSEKVRLDAAKTVLTAAGELAPERDPAGSGGTTIQIITTGPTTIQASSHGVVEAPPFDPRTFAAPALTHTADA